MGPPLVEWSMSHMTGVPFRLFAQIGAVTLVGVSVLACPAVTQAQVSLETIHQFGDDDGTLPAAALIQATDGHFYGTTPNSGASDLGTVFQIEQDGTFTVLHDFEGDTDGARSYAPLIQASDGNFYGTTSEGGPSGLGTIFRMTPDGTFSTLHAFAGGPDDGAVPFSALIQATDGNFYGTTSSGGALGLGTIFVMTPGGAVTILHWFAGGEGDGADPRAALIQATDGNLYGTTRSGGVADSGTVFQIAADSTVTILHTFMPSDGTKPGAALLQATDGSLYGTTENGGDFDGGTVFRMTFDGDFAVVHPFSAEEGWNPVAALIQTIDGTFFGTTSAGDPFANRGTIFQIAPDGTFTVVYAFAGGGDGASPAAALLLATDQSCYGTTRYGGSGEMLGTVFRLIMP
jgi:uncharacterized repeat protein (TIGR03803 family)